MRLLAALCASGLVLIGCGSDGSEQVESGSGSTTTEAPTALGQESADIGDSATYSLSVEPDPPRAGAEVTWRLTIANTGDEPLTLQFRSGQRGDVVLHDGSDEIYRWSADQAFTQAIEHLTIEGGDREIFDLAGPLDVAPGSYTLTATLAVEPEPAPITTQIVVEEAA